MPSSRLVFALSAGLAASTATAASAHVQIRSPEQRTSAQKAGPCGTADSTRGNLVCTFRPGATIDVQYDETVDHPGHYRIAFDADGQDFVDPVDDEGPLTSPGGMEVLVNNAPDKVGGAYTTQITLPDIECDNCTLQLMQVMSTSPPYSAASGDFYWQCADIVLSATEPEGCTGGDAEPEPDAGPDDGGGDNGAGDDAGVGGEPGDDTRTGAAGGCAAAGGSGAGGALLALMALAGYAARRRRR